MVRARLPEPQSPAVQPITSRTTSDAGPSERSGPLRAATNPPSDGHGPMRPGKVTNGAPTSRSDVQRRGNAGSPSGREAVGDGAVVVLRGRESRPHGEGRQVDRDMGEQGTRDADGRPRLSPATGEPCAVKAARTVRGGAVGKGPRGTSPAAYSTVPAGRVTSPPLPNRVHSSRRIGPSSSAPGRYAI